MPYYIAAVMLCAVAGMEWLGYLTRVPRQPILFSIMAAVAVVIGVWRLWRIRTHVRHLKLGRDGERVVGQFLERMRDGGGQVFHDVPGDGFNLDHVVISQNGIYAIETKTISKPWPKATIVVEGDSLRVAGRIPQRNPIEQVSGAARWLECLLEKSTGKRFVVRGVVVFPGWFVEQRSERGLVWVLEPKMLPGFIEHEPVTVAPADVGLAAFHLSRYVRSAPERGVAFAHEPIAVPDSRECQRTKANAELTVAVTRRHRGVIVSSRGSRSRGGHRRKRVRSLES